MRDFVDLTCLCSFLFSKEPRKTLVIAGSSGNFERLTGIFVRSCGQDVLEVRAAWNLVLLCF